MLQINAYFDKIYIFSETKTTFSGTAGTLALDSPQAIYEAKQDCHNQSNKTTQTTRNDLTAQVYSILLKIESQHIL